MRSVLETICSAERHVQVAFGVQPGFESESSDILWRLVFWLFFGIWSASRRKPVPEGLSDSTQTVGGRPEAMLFPESPIPLN